MRWYLAVFKKYFEFNGRARRIEFWMFTLFHCIILFALASVAGFVPELDLLFQWVFGIYFFGVLIPQTAVSIRRLHDANHSGWWLLVGLIPIIGIIAFLVLMAEASEPGENRYGPNPKAGAA